MPMTIDSTSNVCGLNYVNLHLPQIQKFISGYGMKPTFDTETKKVTLEGTIILCPNLSAGVAKILEECKDEISKLEIAFEKEQKRDQFIRELKEFNPSRIVDLLKKYLKIAKPNYSESSKYAYFDEEKHKWIHKPSSPFLGRVAAFYRNVVDYFSSRQSKRRIAEALIDKFLPLQDTSKEKLKAENEPQLIESNSASNDIQVAIKQNESLDPKGGRLGLLLKYSLFANNKDGALPVSSEILVENIVSKLSI